jgi:hypothetical protein
MEVQKMTRTAEQKKKSMKTTMKVPFYKGGMLTQRIA